MKTKKAKQQKKPDQAKSPFPWGDPQKMAEIMESCCQGEGTADCCSMMRSMMERGAEPLQKKPRKTRPEGRENG